MKLDDLVAILESFSSGHFDLDTVHRLLLPVVLADPLDVESSGSESWDEAADESRLFWRLVYLLESEVADSARLRRDVGRLVACFHQTGSADLTLEFLPVLLDQDRLIEITGRHRKRIISRTGLLSFVAESGYPSHVKLWLEHADDGALKGLAMNLEEERYAAVATAFELPPA
jgi:hypothetical protein